MFSLGYPYFVPYTINPLKAYNILNYSLRGRPALIAIAKREYSKSVEYILFTIWTKFVKLVLKGNLFPSASVPIIFTIFVQLYAKWLSCSTIFDLPFQFPRNNLPARRAAANKKDPCSPEANTGFPLAAATKRRKAAVASLGLVKERKHWTKWNLPPVRHIPKWRQRHLIGYNLAKYYFCLV